MIQSPRATSGQPTDRSLGVLANFRGVARFVFRNLKAKEAVNSCDGVFVRAVSVDGADKQGRPTLDAEEVAACITKATGRYAVLYALLAGTGLRVGEALAIHAEPGDHTTISPDCKTIHVRKSIWNGKEQEPKTPAAKRAVDLSDDLAAYLEEYISTRTYGLLFQTDSRKPIAQSNIIRDSLSGLGVSGFYCFRRFRNALLTEADCPEDLKKFWIGHATKDVSELYGKQTTMNLRRRQEWAEKVGLGFKIVVTQCDPSEVANAA
jgi:integrase